MHNRRAPAPELLTVLVGRTVAVVVKFVFAHFGEGWVDPSSEVVAIRESDRSRQLPLALAR